MRGDWGRLGGQGIHDDATNYLPQSTLVYPTLGQFSLAAPSMSRKAFAVEK